MLPGAVLLCWVAEFPRQPKQRKPSRRSATPYNYLHAARIGEASSLKPRTMAPAYLTFTVANVTRLKRYHEEVLNLIPDIGLRVLCLAETSAYENALRQFKKRCSPTSLTFSHGSVCGHRGRCIAKEGPTYGGVAVLHNVRGRFPQNQSESDVWRSTRYVENIVQIGPIQILVVCLYLFPAGEPEEKQVRSDISQSLMWQAAVQEWGGICWWVQILTTLAGAAGEAPKACVVTKFCLLVFESKKQVRG